MTFVPWGGAALFADEGKAFHHENLGVTFRMSVRAAHEFTSGEVACMDLRRVCALHFASYGKLLVSPAPLSSPWHSGSAGLPPSSRSCRVCSCVRCRSTDRPGSFCWEITWEITQALPSPLARSEHMRAPLKRSPIPAVTSTQVMNCLGAPPRSE